MSEKFYLESSFEYSVQFDDIYIGGVVYNGNYIKIFERARTALLGESFMNKLLYSGEHFAIKNINIDFKRPAKLFDKLTVKTVIKCDLSPVLKVNHICYNGDNVICSADITLFFLDSQNKPKKVYKDLFNEVNADVKVSE